MYEISKSLGFDKDFKISKGDFKIIIQDFVQRFDYLTYLGFARDFNVQKYTMKIDNSLLVKGF